MNLIKKLLFVLCIVHITVSLHALPTFDEIVKNRNVRKLTGVICILNGCAGLCGIPFAAKKRRKHSNTLRVAAIMAAANVFGGYLLLKDSSGTTDAAKDVSALSLKKDNSVPVAQGTNVQQKLAQC